MAQAKKKIVFLAGSKSHGPGEHEYDRGLTLLSRCLPKDTVSTGVHPYGWPDDERTLDDADCIVLYADGSDHNERDHPLLIGNRLAVLKRQMDRGCGFVTLHYATFAPVKRGGPEYLDWVGGFFDYETGSGVNHWASAIQHWRSQVIPVSGHPVNAGTVPFDVNEEWYYKMRLNPRHVPLLQVVLPGEKEPQTVAWALERPNGGRGFACTGGHHHENWKIDTYRKVILRGILWAAHAPLSPTPPPPDADAIRVLILTGRHHPAHDWTQTTPALVEVLQRDGRGAVTVWTDPEKLATANLSSFDLIVQNYCNWESPTLSSASRASLLGFVRNGGGLLLVHFANGAWRDWPEYAGRLSRRVWIDGKANHDAFGPFPVHIANPNHRLTAGLIDFATTDELYCSQVGALPVEPLLTARSRVTGRDEPLAYVYTEGKGRIFQTLLGHDAAAVRTPEHAELIRRAAAWVARREVLPLPVVIPQVKTEPVAKGVLDARRGGKQAPGDTRWLEPPLTVSCRVRLLSKNAFNILIASAHKDSPRHWELYTEAGSGHLAAYLPGAAPTNLTSTTDLCDGAWHTVQLDYLPSRLRLWVDGKTVADTAIGMAHVTAAVGPLWLGCYPPQALGCDGFLDDISLQSQGRTLVKYEFEGDEGLKNAENSDASLTPTAPLDVSGSWPKVDKRTSTNWADTGGDPGRTRHSELKQVNKATVKNLKQAWTFRSGDAKSGTTIECTPIVIEGVMYLTTVDLRIVALDAATGKALWVHATKSGGVNRGVCYWSDGKVSRILCGLPDGRLISLDAKTGKLDPKFGKGGTVYLRDGYKRDLTSLNYGCTSAPALFENLVIIPIINSEGQPGAPGDIRAFDVRTGKEVWRFHTVPEPGELGNDTWAKDSWKERSGTNAWAGYTVDTKNAIVFASTGSAASDFYGADRHGKNLFANCLIALDARTGKRLWHFQTVHHDLWDHDNPCPTVLCQVKGVEAVAQPTKTGFIYVFERKSGKSLFPIEERPAPPSSVSGEKAWPTQPYPTAPPPLTPQVITLNDLTNRTREAAEEIRKRVLDKQMKFGDWRIPPSLEGSLSSPGFHGGANWSGASVDPKTGHLYINTNNVPSIVQLKPNGQGGYDFAGYLWFRDKDGYPGVKPPWGSLTAVDLNTGTFAWRVPLGSYPELRDKTTGSENFGGTIVTAGGLVFIAATRDELIRAFDKDTGKLLWQAKLPAGGYATPCTYQVNGKQFIVIAAGGGGKIGTRSGDTYVAFALPD